MKSRIWLGFIVFGVTIGCAAPSSPSPNRGDGSAAPNPAQQRTLVVAFRGEPPSLASKALVVVDGSVRGPIPMLNASLDGLDERGQSFPYLAEGLPQLNSESWQLFPDGRMETRYRLRDGLTWHDGTALSADDFVFAWRVFATPAFGQAASPPISFIEEMAAPDSRSVVIRWRQSFGDAGALADSFQPLPRHLLLQSLQELDPSAFVNLPFWSVDYVGLGAYRVEKWEPGASSKRGLSMVTR